MSSQSNPGDGHEGGDPQVNFGRSQGGNSAQPTDAILGDDEAQAISDAPGYICPFASPADPVVLIPTALEHLRAATLLLSWTSRVHIPSSGYLKETNGRPPS